MPSAFPNRHVDKGDPDYERWFRVEFLDSSGPVGRVHNRRTRRRDRHGARLAPLCSGGQMNSTIPPAARSVPAACNHPPAWTATTMPLRPKPGPIPDCPVKLARERL